MNCGRLNANGTALWRARIFAGLRCGWPYESIARDENATPRRIRQIVS
jgi:hypothetical protein